VVLSAPRAAHQREGHERFTLDRILAEEMAVLDLVDVRDDRALLWVKDEDTAALSADQKRAVENIGRSPWLIQPLSAPAGAGKTTSMRALRAAAHRRRGAAVLVLAPTGKAVDVAVREGAGDEGLTIAKALQLLRDNTLQLDRSTLVIVDEAAMVGTDDLRCRHHRRRGEDGLSRRCAPARAGQSPRRHVRPTVHRPALDTTPFRGLAHARPRRTHRLPRAA